VRAVAIALGVEAADLEGPTRGPADIALARQMAMYVARVTLGMTLQDAGLLFGRDRTTAAHACRIVEDRRDDARFDAILSKLENDLLRHAVDADRARRRP